MQVALVKLWSEDLKPQQEVCHSPRSHGHFGRYFAENGVTVQKIWSSEVLTKKVNFGQTSALDLIADNLIDEKLFAEKLIAEKWLNR